MHRLSSQSHFLTKSSRPFSCGRCCTLCPGLLAFCYRPPHFLGQKENDWACPAHTEPVHRQGFHAACLISSVGLFFGQCLVQRRYKAQTGLSWQSHSLWDQIFKCRRTGNSRLKCFDLQYVSASQPKQSNNISLSLPSCHQSTVVFQKSITLYTVFNVIISVHNYLYSSRVGSYYNFFFCCVRLWKSLQQKVEIKEIILVQIWFVKGTQISLGHLDRSNHCKLYFICKCVSGCNSCCSVWLQWINGKREDGDACSLMNVYVKTRLSKRLYLRFLQLALKTRVHLKHWIGGLIVLPFPDECGHLFYRALLSDAICRGFVLHMTGVETRAVCL